MVKASSSAGWKSQVITFHSNPHIRAPSPAPGPGDASSSNQVIDSPIREPSSKSHGRKKPAGHIPRPRNAFILFRSDFVQNNRVPVSVENNHQNISRIAGKVWGNMSDVEKGEWYTRAQQERELHAKKYPDYQYSPTDPVTLGHRRQVRKGRSVAEVKTQSRHCEKVASLVVEGRSGSTLEQAMKEPETVAAGNPPPQLPGKVCRGRPSSATSSLEEEDGPSGATRTLSFSSVSSGLSLSSYISKEDNLRKATPINRPAAHPYPMPMKPPSSAFRVPPTHRFASVLPSKVRSYGAPPTFPQISRPMQDTSGSWSLRGVHESSDEDEEDDCMSDD